jgi:hypothetical protein
MCEFSINVHETEIEKVEGLLIKAIMKGELTIDESNIIVYVNHDGFDHPAYDIYCGNEVIWDELGLHIGANITEDELFAMTYTNERSHYETKELDEYGNYIVRCTEAYNEYSFTVKESFIRANSRKLKIEKLLSENPD